MSKQTTVYCKVSFEGAHFWKDAPVEVEFLREKHRHIFHVTAYKTVTHSDRDVEFIMLGREIKAWIVGNFPTYNGVPSVIDIGQTSCEMLAEMLCSKFGLSKCEVSEDAENGAVVEIIESE